MTDKKCVHCNKWTKPENRECLAPYNMCVCNECAKTHTSLWIPIKSLEKVR